MIKKLSLLSFFFAFMIFFNSHAAKSSFYQIKIYSISSVDQEQMLDAYLKDAYIPAMHRLGIKSIGVFKPRANTEDKGKKVYVLTPLKSQKQLLNIESKLSSDVLYQNAGSEYINAMYDNKPFERFETIILKAFEEMPQMAIPNLNGPKKDRVYELRSYEGPTEKYYRKKVEMFNKGGEVTLFKRLNFNAVFYGEVISGSQMPNLMYLTTFENQKDRDEHWDAFRTAPEWLILKEDKQYAHSVSKNTQYFLYPTEYSEI